ncbi:hypothetical protein LTR85_004241 [Meristemomyces frigidus]|nr:hypothetical protein LTR85_004241 [Meristemomyces frigidus]
MPAGVHFPMDDSDGDSTTSNYTFYLKHLPRGTLAAVPLVVLAYKWQCWLERTFPGRPRGKPDLFKQAGEKKELAISDDEQLEEEIMRKLIAKGKVRRSSISWCNTLFKWLLDNTIGVLFFASGGIVLSKAMELQAPSHIWAHLKSDVPVTLLGNFFTPDPLRSLVGFVVVPVQYRLPFAAGADLLTTVFVGAFLHAFIPWAMSKQIVQDVMRNATQAAWSAQNATKNGTVVDESRLNGLDGKSSRPTRLIFIDGAGEYTKLRLTEAYGSDAPYVSLSYCWGGADQFKTTRESHAQRLNGFRLEHLPKTYRDAVFICQELNIEYLWIDALCIIQDDQSDWEQEVPRMGGIYGNAYLVVAVIWRVPLPRASSLPGP